MKTEDPIITFLREEKFLSEENLQVAIDQQQKTGQSLISILRGKNLLDEEQFTRVIAVANKIKFINLSPEDVDPMVAHLVSYQMANRHNLIPIKMQDNQLLVAMSSPLNLSARDQVEMRTGYKVVPVAVTPAAVKQAINYHFNVQNVTRQAIASMRLKERSGENVEDSEVKQKPTKLSSAPITKLVSSIINGAIDARASDIHLEPQQSDMRVRYRVDGILHDAINVPLSAQQEVVSHLKVMSQMDISERRLPQDGHIILKYDSNDYDLRVSSLPAFSGEKIVIRILDKASNKWGLETIATLPGDNEKFGELIKKSFGMILLTGPTGSGKTTTLYSILKTLNTPDKNIITVEDPVEYCLEGVTQVQIKPLAGVTFASTLRSILRQDPDIILVGEIRDLETAEIAIRAALTGHLVLSTLHTNDSVGAISRLINIGLPPFLLASSLMGIVAQRLIRTSCSKCKQAYQPSKDELGCLFSKSHTDERIKLYHGKGCNSCSYTGFSGRKAIFEILCISHKIRKMIADNNSENIIKQQAMEEGMKTLQESGINEILNGTTTFEELMRVVDIRTS